MKTQSWVKFQFHSFFNLGARWGLVVNATPRPLYPREKNPVPIIQEAGWASGPIWTGAEKLAPIGVQFPDLLVRIESLYRLSYPFPHNSLSSCIKLLAVFDGGSTTITAQYSLLPCTARTGSSATQGIDVQKCFSVLVQSSEDRRLSTSRSDCESSLTKCLKQDGVTPIKRKGL
jgi:hypothetical protein